MMRGSFKETEKAMSEPEQSQVIREQMSRNEGHRKHRVHRSLFSHTRQKRLEDLVKNMHVARCSRTIQHSEPPELRESKSLSNCARSQCDQPSLGRLNENTW